MTTITFQTNLPLTILISLETKNTEIVHALRPDHLIDGRDRLGDSPEVKRFLEELHVESDEEDTGENKDDEGEGGI